MSDAADALRQVPLLAGLSARQLRHLAGKLRERRFEPGTTVVREGEMSGIGFFVVTSGTGTVSRRGRGLVVLGPGDHFGELALVAERERTATVTATTRLECLELPAWDFRQLVQGDGELAWTLLQHVVTTLLDERSDRPTTAG